MLHLIRGCTVYVCVCVGGVIAIITPDEEPLPY